MPAGIDPPRCPIFVPIFLPGSAVSHPVDRESDRRLRESCPAVCQQRSYNNGIRPICRLPPGVLAMVAEYLSVRSIIALKRTSRRTYAHVADYEGVIARDKITHHVGRLRSLSKRFEYRGLPIDRAFRRFGRHICRTFGHRGRESESCYVRTMFAEAYVAANPGWTTVEEVRKLAMSLCQISNSIECLKIGPALKKDLEACENFGPLKWYRGDFGPLRRSRRGFPLSRPLEQHLCDPLWFAAIWMAADQQSECLKAEVRFSELANLMEANLPLLAGLIISPRGVLEMLERMCARPLIELAKRPRHKRLTADENDMLNKMTVFPCAVMTSMVERRLSLPPHIKDTFSLRVLFDQVMAPSILAAMQKRTGRECTALTWALMGNVDSRRARGCGDEWTWRVLAPIPKETVRRAEKFERINAVEIAALLESARLAFEAPASLY